MPRNGIDLSRKLGHSEAVNHVIGLDLHPQLLSRGEMDLVRRDNVGPRIINLPPLLMTGDDQIDRVVTRLLRS